MQAMQVEQERRRVRRTDVLIHAKIIHRSAIFDCTVQNLTNLGARLELENANELPKLFELTFDSVRTRRPCRAIWRQNEKIGVSFECNRSQLDWLHQA